MAGIKISALPAAPSAQLTDVFPIDGLPGPVTYKLANSQLLSLFQANMVASITGTPNQVIASSPTGAVTLSLPQSIATTSSPQFAAVKTPTILDSNGNIMLQFTTAPSAVNYIDITNSATGGGGTFFAKGTDPNINMGFITQGTGSFFLDSANTTTPLVINSGTTLQHTTNLIFADTANTRNITFPDASGTLSLTSGTVSSVSGTTNRITSTGGTTPVIDIAATYVGQSSITTLGTIGTGTWQGSVIGGTYGGTGVNNGASTITLGGSLTTSGAFASTFTMTGITNVTFPTSGTLSTTTGTVTSVSGTTNRITSTGGATPVIDISASYVGQTSITTLGTVGTGTWQASIIGMTYGGTGANLTPSNGGIIYSNATALAVLAGTATAQQLLMSGASTTPQWSTSTYPLTNAVNTLLYASSANVMAALTTANSSVLVTSGGGVPSLSTTLPSGLAATNLTLTTPAIGTPSSGVATNLTATGGVRSFQVFTSGSAATYTKPANVTSILVELLGGGGGGGGCTGGATAASAGGGGGGGGYANLYIASAASTYTYTVGTGGAGGLAGNNTGTGGNTTTFSASSLQATGGAGGGGKASIPVASVGGTSVGGAGGIGSNGNINAAGGAGSGGVIISGAVLSGNGGSTVYGAGGLGTIGQAVGNVGGAYGGGGAGGGCGASSQAGGAGANGLIIVWEFS